MNPGIRMSDDLLQPGDFVWGGPCRDYTGHAPAVANRPQRSGFQAIVLHRIGNSAAEPDGREGRSADAVVRFFTADPEGVATVTLSGSHDEKLPTIERWRRDGVPEEMAARAFVPYTFLVEPDGALWQMLPLGTVGAHAVSYNAGGVGVALIGDFRAEEPAPAQVDAGVAVCAALLRRYRTDARAVRVLGHDEVRTPPKQCPGPRFPLDLMRQRIAAGR